MRRPKNIPSSGLFSSVVAQVNENFLLQYQQLLQYLTDHAKFCGQYATEDALKSAYPTAKIGCYAYVSEVSEGGDSSGAVWLMYRWNGTKWVNSGETIAAGMVTINQDQNTSSGVGAVLEEDLVVKKAVGYLTVNQKFTKGTKLETILRKMLYQVTSPSVSVSASSTAIAVGSNYSSVHFTITCAKNDGGDVESITVVYAGKTYVYSESSNAFTRNGSTYTFTPQDSEYTGKTPEGELTCTVTVKFKKNDSTGVDACTKTASTTVGVYYKYYIGMYSTNGSVLPSTLNDSTVSAFFSNKANEMLASGKLCTSKTITQSAIGASTNNVVVVLVPEEPTLTRMYQSGQLASPATAFYNNITRLNGSINVVISGVNKTYYYELWAAEGNYPSDMSFDLSL